MNGHCHIHGIVQLQKQPSTKKKKDDDFVQLEFSYERTPTPKNGTNIVYTIWKSYNYDMILCVSRKQQLINVQVERVIQVRDIVIDFILVYMIANSTNLHYQRF